MSAAKLEQVAEILGPDRVRFARDGAAGRSNLRRLNGIANAIRHSSPAGRAFVTQRSADKGRILPLIDGSEQRSLGEACRDSALCEALAQKGVSFVRDEHVSRVPRSTVVEVEVGHVVAKLATKGNHKTTVYHSSRVWLTTATLELLRRAALF